MDMMNFCQRVTIFRQSDRKRRKGELSHLMITPGMKQDMIVEFLECLDEGVHIVNAEGSTIYYNKVASQLDGMPADEVIGMHVLEAFPSLTHKSSTLLSVLKTGQALEEREQTFMNRKGKRVTTINRTIPLRSKGKVVGAAEISKDLTRMKELSDQVLHLQERIRHPRGSREQEVKRFYSFDDIVTQNPLMLKEIERARRAARTHSPVLVIGETGTGKELFVQAIHRDSSRRDQPFIVQNCAAIPASLLEGILFGTARGAFTGAEDRPGLVELADGGTLFLDEIHAMPIDLQAKLLRVLEDGQVRRVGGTELRSFDVRVIVATNEDPLLSIKEGRLRRDLYYRIHVVGIHLPPLRERPEDITCLTHYFFRKLKGQWHSPVKRIADEVMEAFVRYDWPGNVRELEHTVEGALNLALEEELQLVHLPRHFQAIEPTQVIRMKGSGGCLREMLWDVEARLIREAMEEAGGNVLQAAKRLGIPRQTLQYKLKKLNERKRG
ncbi:arginine utilization regulatory protein [Laceyella tengchongensis]|uniref:Arginine utilization regulatory protein n=1 Tax=Laceyella tengchongensis TaxID=574699 RepID=A0AA45WQG3_9BACL|nr:arginine utilization regulatory protein [Laceyella tengchongensis]